MFSAMLFAQDRVGAKTVERLALESQEVCIYKTMHAFPSPYEMTRLMNTFQPDLVLVELHPLDDALVVARTVRLLSAQTAVIGYQTEGVELRADPDALLDAGVLETLPSPLTLESFQQALQAAVRKARPEFQDNLLAFLPAKAGSGATTVAINVAGCLARDFDQKALVIDVDLHSGLVAVLLKVAPEYSIVNALENSALLDGTLWSRIVARAHGMDLLLTPKPSKPMHVSWAKYHQLLQFVRGRYDTVVVDLPEVVNDATVEIVRRARKVFIVTTPELPSLVLARQRALTLKNRGISAYRIGIVVNRWRQGEVEISEIERFVGESVAAVFHNDYQCVRRATQEGRLIGPKSELGRAYTAFAQRLTGAAPPPATPADQPKAHRGFLGSLISR
jgi:Flp pilus assembly CpaE family ATPase